MEILHLSDHWSVHSKLAPFLSRISLFASYAIGLAGLAKDDVLLSSFPRSGSTWLRFIFCNLVSLAEWDGSLVDFSILNQTMIELGVNNLFKPSEYQTFPRIVKTHRPYTRFFWRNVAIGLIRDPRDVMISYYHFKKDRQGTFNGSLSEFIRTGRYGLEAWFGHFLSWRDHWNFLIRYEDLKVNPFREVSRTLDFLEVQLRERTIREAIERSSLERIRAADPHRLATSEKGNFARSGRSKQWVELFSREDLALYERLAKAYEFSLYPLGE